MLLKSYIWGNYMPFSIILEIKVTWNYNKYHCTELLALTIDIRNIWIYLSTFIAINPSIFNPKWMGWGFL